MAVSKLALTSDKPKTPISKEELLEDTSNWTAVGEDEQAEDDAQEEETPESQEEQDLVEPQETPEEDETEAQEEEVEVSEDEESEEDEEVIPQEEAKKPSRAEQRIKSLVNQKKQLQEFARIKDEDYTRRELELLQTIAQLQGQNQEYTEALSTTYASGSDEAITAAEEALERAQEAGDVKAITKANRALAEAVSRKADAQRYAAIPKKGPTIKPEALNYNDILATRKSTDWQRSNQALLQNPTTLNIVKLEAQKVEATGLTPVSDEYFEQINTNVNKTLKNLGIKLRAKSPFEDFIPTDGTEEVEEEVTTTEKKPKAPVVKKPLNPVSSKAPRMNSSNSRKVVARLSPEEIAEARRFNVDPKNLLRQKLFNEKNKDKHGYNRILVHSTTKGRSKQ